MLIVCTYQSFLVDEQNARVCFEIYPIRLLDNFEAFDRDVGLISEAKAYEIQHRVGLSLMVSSATQPQILLGGQAKRHEGRCFGSDRKNVRPALELHLSPPERSFVFRPSSLQISLQFTIPSIYSHTPYLEFTLTNNHHGGRKACQVQAGNSAGERQLFLVLERAGWQERLAARMLARFSSWIREMTGSRSTMIILGI